jgi:hypothetical protein
MEALVLLRQNVNSRDNHLTKERKCVLKEKVSRVNSSTYLVSGTKVYLCRYQAIFNKNQQK